MKGMILKCIFKCISNNCKPPQNFDFRKTEMSFRFIWFEKFPCVCFSWLMGGWNLLPSSGLIVYKKGSSEYFYKKPNQTWPKAVGTLKKNQNNTPTRTQKRARYKLFRYMLIVFYPLSVPLLFLKEGNKITKKLSRGSIFKNISRGNQKGEGRGNAKVIERCNFFIFIFSLLAMMVTGTVFRKASLENLY